MAETLKDVIDRLADELVSFTRDAGHAGNYKRAMREAIHAALAEPTTEMIFAGMKAYQDFGTPMTRYRNIHQAMAAERLKELE